jgi:hypothetical protein
MVQECRLLTSPSATPLTLSAIYGISLVLQGGIMPESTPEKAHSSSDRRLILMSKELEDATNLFLMKIEELEKLLPLIDE